MRNDRGQIILILVLITVVGLTIGLSLVSRTITDIRISSQIEQSSRAFSAAEAGIETALKSNIAVVPTGTVSLVGASANYQVQTIGGSTANIDLPITAVGSNQTVWLIEHDANGAIVESGYSYPVNQQLEICFNNLMNNPAVMISIFYKENTSYKVAKKAFESSTAHGSNNLIMSDTLGSYCNGKYQNRVIAMPATDANAATHDFGISPVNTKLLFLRLQPIYDTTAFTLKPAANMPIQGRIITSVGQTQTNVVRKIQVFQGFSILPSLLDFAFFSEN